MVMNEAGAARADDVPLVSIIVPAYNEEQNLPRLEVELAAALDGLPYAFEFIVVDNRSTDGTQKFVEDLCERDPRWRYIRFSRNFQLESSITAGYRAASGDAMIVLYSDLQDPPDQIPVLLAKWREGYDVVYGVRTVRPGDPKWRNLAVKYHYKLMTRLSEVDIPANAGDFRLITRRVRDALDQCGEYNRYTRGLIAWLGFRQVGVLYERRPRIEGKSKFGFVEVFVFAFTAITSFSLKPLRLFALFGFAVLGLVLLSLPVFVALYLAGDPPPGVTTIAVLVLLAIGFNSLGIGVLGEYLGRTIGEVRGRPLYVVDELRNFDERSRAAIVPGRPTLPDAGAHPPTA